MSCFRSSEVRSQHIQTQPANNTVPQNNNSIESLPINPTDIENPTDIDNLTGIENPTDILNPDKKVYLLTHCLAYNIHKLQKSRPEAEERMTMSEESYVSVDIPTNIVIKK